MRQNSCKIEVRKYAPGLPGAGGEGDLVPSCLISTGEENLTVTAAAARRLLERGDGDAALLYLALLRHRGTVMPRSLAGELRCCLLYTSHGTSLVVHVGLAVHGGEKRRGRDGEEH